MSACVCNAIFKSIYKKIQWFFLIDQLVVLKALLMIRPSCNRTVCCWYVCTGDSLCCASEEGPSAATAEVKQEILSQTASYSTSHNELNDTLLMEPSEIKMYPTEDTPASGETEQLEETSELISQIIHFTLLV